MKPSLDQLNKPLLNETPESIIEILTFVRYIVLVGGLFGLLVLIADDKNMSGVFIFLSIFSLLLAVLSVFIAEKLFVFLFQLREAAYHIAFSDYDSPMEEDIEEEGE